MRGNYQPTQVDAGSTYEETAAVVVYLLNQEPSKKYDELVKWQKILANPLRVTVE